MRRSIALGAVAALAVALLAGCTAGPSPEAVKAAEDYGDKLTAWSQELSTALKTARTATPDEREAADGDLNFTEVGLGDVLDEKPKLKKLEGIENSPTYVTAARAAKQVDGIVAELEAFEPEGLAALRETSSEAYTVVADLYYDSLDADTARLKAFTAASDIEDEVAHDDAVREAQRDYWVARAALVKRAATASSTVAGEAALGASVAAFMADWYTEEAAFDDEAVKTIGGFTVYTRAYGTYWNYGNLNTALSVPAANAAVLRPAYVEQIGALAAVVTSSTTASPAPSKQPELPALGDPYREILLGGYLPWGDAAEGHERTVDRLWMLWRIRELEKTPEGAYTTARLALMEESNRGLDEDDAEDFRPGADRLLELVGQYSDNFDTYELDERGLTKLEEILAYGVVLRGHPMLPEVATDFDALIALYTELNGEISEAISAYPDEYDRYAILKGLQVEYEKKITDAASPSLELLDDDARAEALTVAALKATVPGAKVATPTPKASRTVGASD